MERDPAALTFYFSQIDPRGEGSADENRRFARSMTSEAMRDILYGEHDSIKHSIKSSLINLTLAHGGGRRWDPRGAPPPLSYSASPIVGAISGRCLRERERERERDGPYYRPYVTLGTLRWRDGPGAPRFEIAATLAWGNLPYYLWARRNIGERLIILVI